MVLGFEMVREKIICNLFSNYSVSQVVFTVHCVMIIASFGKKHCYNKIFLVINDWHSLFSMQSRVQATVRCLSICLSHLPSAAACGGFAAVGQAGIHAHI